MIIMTSNVGSAAIFELAEKDLKKARAQAMEALRAIFRPEFLNRVDDIVMFLPLGKKQLERIVDLQIHLVEKQVASRHIKLRLSEAARELILKEGYDPAYGARPLRRAIQRLVQDSLAMQILDGEIAPGDEVLADADQGADEIKFIRVVKGQKDKKEESAAPSR